MMPSAVCADCEVGSSCTAALSSSRASTLRSRPVSDANMYEKPSRTVRERVLGILRQHVFLGVDERVEVAGRLRRGRVQKRKRERVVGDDGERRLEALARGGKSRV